MSVSTPNNSQEQLLQSGWAALPPSYRMPARVPTLDEAQAYCKQLTESHYENFHVASWFLPKRLRVHFHSVYAYCRIADDLGDEVGNPEQSLALLNWWEQQLDLCYKGEASHPVFVALAETVRICEIPKQPFADLLVAFRQDQTITRFETHEQMAEYARYSANPVGRLVLYMCGYSDEERFALSDFTCTGLQVANFLQDVSVDYKKGRIYLPEQDRERHEVPEAVIAAGVATPEFRELMRYEVGYAYRLFGKGEPLIHMVDRELALDLDLFTRGGLEILRAIEAQGYDVLRARPSIPKSRKLKLLMSALMSKFLGRRP